MTSVNFSSGLPETVLPADPLDATLSGGPSSYDEVAKLVASHPRSLIGWATLADLATDQMSKYAFFRIGYHRGLDTLRANGWRGSGYVRGAHPTNRGFLRCLDGLRRMANEIGEHDEAERCAQFLGQLDPEWPVA
ncbi:MAG: DUF3151 domain-containing protein [Acidimicrobiales bacterium]|nr:DUF3151 domain-containing protein [Acidimicrobiales bacterium]